MEELSFWHLFPQNYSFTTRCMHKGLKRKQAKLTEDKTVEIHYISYPEIISSLGNIELESVRTSGKSDI